jgi:hypothetical protein
MSDSKAPRKNWIPQIIRCAGVALFQIYQLAAPGEAQPTALIVLEWVLLGCGVIGFGGALAMHFSQR